MPADSTKKDEYFDVSNNMRLYINMRFAQLTLFIAITAALLNVVFGKDPPIPLGTSISLKLGGLLAVAVFWVMEERAADFFHHYKRRAIELEKALGYSQYTRRPERKAITATNAVRVFFGTLGIFWLISLVLPSLLS